MELTRRNHTFRQIRQTGTALGQCCPSRFRCSNTRCRPTPLSLSHLDTFSEKSKQWKKNSDKGRLERTFCQWIMSPICKMFDAIMEDKTQKIQKMLTAVGVTLSRDERELVGKPLLKRVMQKWLPAADAILEMVVVHLPSPPQAQKYRVENLYDGPLDDEVAHSIRTCDTSPGAPLCM